MSDYKDKIAKARLKGMSYSEIANKFNVSKSTAHKWGHTRIKTSTHPKVKRVNHPIKSEDGIKDFLENLRPIDCGKIKPDTNSYLSEFGIVGSDFHFGCEDKKAIDIFLATVDDIKPKIIILNGDTMDFLAISKYPKDIKHSWSLLDERVAYRKFLHTLIEVSAGAEIYETYSNHSGGSVDGRWRRYLSDRIGELSSLPDITDILSYENVFMGEFQNHIKHVDYVNLDGLIVTHGNSVRSAGGASCLAEMNKWGCSVLHGHTHRIGSSAKRIPKVGSRGEDQLYAFEGGCLCSLDAAYGSHMNWNKGFNIVGLGGDTFSVEQVMINKDMANIATLGYTIKA